MGNYNIEDILCSYSALPVCVINVRGEILSASGMANILLYGKVEGLNIQAITGYKAEEFISAALIGDEIKYKGNDKIAQMIPKFLSNGNTAIYFRDVTKYENLKTLYNNERACMAIVQVDNYDELRSAESESGIAALDAEIEKVIRYWSSKIDASVTKYKRDYYFLVFQYGAYEWIRQDKFSILDDIRQIETDADFPCTLSIGIGIGGLNFQESDQFAQAALDLALGRGGDQAVVKFNTQFEYYGGRTKAVEKTNKGKSRIIYYGFKTLVNQADKVIIMGHKYPDMDAFGAALGIHRIAKSLKNEVYIVINEYNDALAEVFNRARDSEEYEFISSEKAMNIVTEDTLVVLLDTHRAFLAECPELVEKCEKLVNIDHHRRAEDAITKAILVYAEPYASSTSELVTEMLQYAGAKKSISKLEAEALLGGIMIDTNKFAVQTGVRTFEAAGWLKRAGADTSTVKRFFRVDEDTFVTRAAAIARAEIGDGVAYSYFTDAHQDAQIISAQSADELLTVKGIKASFVAGVNMMGRTVISARSLGDVNVQTVMEKLGGGGHLTTAGAQVDCSPEEAIEKIKQIFKED